MNHEQATPLLSELLGGKLPAAETREAWEHVATCEECQQVVSTMHQVRSASAELGPAFYSCHPSPDDIVRFALVDPELPSPELAQIGDHVRACDVCTEAVNLTRRADEATRGPRRRWLAPPATGWIEAVWPRLAPALAPALAALVVVLAYPAYRGLTDYPSLARKVESDSRSLEALRASEGRLRQDIARRADSHEAPAWAGPVRLLYLPASTRGVEDVPSVARRPDQLYQPVVIQHRPFPGANPTGDIDVTLRRQSDQAIVWSAERPVSELWDPAYSSLVVLLPARVLTAGAYQLEIRRDGTPTYQAEFAVTDEKK